MPKTQRIAFISGLRFGGATTFVCNLAGELVRRHMPVIVISPERDNVFATDFQAAGVRAILHDHLRMIFQVRLNCVLRTLAPFLACHPSAFLRCIHNRLAGTSSIEASFPSESQC
jgi:hypothetical protein